MGPALLCVLAAPPLGSPLRSSTAQLSAGAAGATRAGNALLGCCGARENPTPGRPCSARASAAVAAAGCCPSLAAPTQRLPRTSSLTPPLQQRGYAAGAGAASPHPPSSEDFEHATGLELKARRSCARLRAAARSRARAGGVR